jgi:two-component system, OmpR family, response regulator
MRVLIVEDEPNLGRQLRSTLEGAGYAVDLATDGEDGHYLGSTESYDAIILDLGLPEVDGLTVLDRWRKEGRKMPVLVLTARDSWSDKVAGLDAGADDYLVKPFELAELEARVRALIRRSHGRDRNLLVHGALAFDSVARTASVDGETLDLSAREIAVLELLLLRSGRVIAKEQFVEHLCGWDEDVTENAIEVYVHRLRRKLEPAGVNVQTVRGLGYYLPKA